MEKNIDIYNLYKYEQEIVHELPDGEKLVLYITKPNHHEKEKIHKAMMKAKDDALLEIKDSPSLQNNVDEMVNSYTKTERIESILTAEELQLLQSSDLFPIGDRENMTTEEMNKAEQDFLAQWREKRKAQLGDSTDEELNIKVKTIIVDSRSMLMASEAYHKYMMLYCVKDKNRENIFKTIDDIGKLDDILYIWLVDEINKFITIMSQKDIRKVVQDKDFLSPIESEKSSTEQTTLIT